MKHASTKLPLTLALATPAVRMVVVEACATRTPAGWVTDSAVFPVLALVARHRHVYFHPAADPLDYPPARAPTPPEMEALGWRPSRDGPDLDFDVLIHHPEYGLCAGEFGLNCTNCAYETVVCDWPPGEDARRLEPVIELLKARAIEGAEGRDRREGGGP